MSTNEQADPKQLDTWTLAYRMEEASKRIGNIDSRLATLAAEKKQLLTEREPLENELWIRLRTSGGVLVTNERAYFSDDLGELQRCRVLSTMDVDDLNAKQAEPPETTLEESFAETVLDHLETQS